MLGNILSSRDKRDKDDALPLLLKCPEFQCKMVFCIHHKPMVESVVNLNHQQLFQIPKVQNHPFLRSVCIRGNGPTNSHFDFVTMSMEISTFAFMIRHPMPHVEFDNS